MLRRSLILCNYPKGGVLPVRNPATTHTVLNQVPYFEGYNAYRMWPRLGEGIATYGAAAHYEQILEEMGQRAGNPYWLLQAERANKREPVFTLFERQGRRVNGVTFDESYHRLMRMALTNGCASIPFEDPTLGHLAGSTLFMLYSMLEMGTSCPITMTTACIASLKLGGSFYEPWVTKLTARDYDPRDLHISLKTAATCGMSMTEKQGGSDVRQNTTFAVPLDTANRMEQGAPYRITGHKWFTSAPMSDSFLTLAYSADEELSCFMIPRWISPTERNVGLRFQRLKAKMGDKSNASSEVEYNNAIGYLLGEAGGGVKTIMQMVNHTRLLCTIGSCAIMAPSVSHAVHHATHRKAFGGKLIDTPLMQNVLSDLMLEVEGSMALAQRVAHSFDNQSGLSKDYVRVAVALGKYIICKRTPAVVNESMECLGGNGYLEDFPLARAYRQAPLNAIWEGSGNVIVLDLFRVLQKTPEAFEAIVADIVATKNPLLVDEIHAIAKELKCASLATLEISGRFLVERLGTLLQAAALYHGKGDPSVYELFSATRVGPQHARRGVQFGTLESKHVNPALIRRNTPQLEPHTESAMTAAMYYGAA